MKLRRLSVASLLLAITVVAAIPGALAKPSAQPEAKPTAFHTDVIFLDVVQASRGVALYEL